MRPFKFSGPILIASCAIFLIAQVLVRPATGLADNGDFPKMAGPFGLGPEAGSWETRDQFGEFIFRFVKADRYNYARDLARAEFLSSEYFLIKIARGVQRIVYPGPRFDIRWLGGVNGILFLLAIGIWIYALPPRWRFIAGLFIILIWSDSAYVEYLNSFYMDTAAMIFLVLFVAAALHFVKNRESRIFALIMALAAVLFAASKSQHAVPGLLLVPLMLIYALWSHDTVVRVTFIGGAVLLIWSVWFAAARVGPDWGNRNIYNVVFMHITPGSSDPLRTLEDLGLGRDELHLVGTYAYMDRSPIQNPEWAKGFRERCNYGVLLRYYVRHPLATASLIYSKVHMWGPFMRPWGNLAREDGFTGRAQSTRFTLWSNVRSYLLGNATWHVFALEFIAILGALWLLFGSTEDRAFATLLLVVQFIALLECAGSILADGVETQRHLFLFHVATDATILLLPPLIWRMRTLICRRAA